MRINLTDKVRDDDEARWLQLHAPLFECPDEVLQRTYYYRWSVFRKHLKLTPAGYVVTEFLPDVPWAGTYNTISCPAGHHFYEGRWLRNPAYLDDYAAFWFRGGGEPRRYSFWAADALHARYLVTGDADILLKLLPDLVRNFGAWEAERKDESGLFWQIDDRDGMEFSLGGLGLRPTINSYMYADAATIAAIAELAGDGELAEIYRRKAWDIKALTEKLLWDEEAKFFKVRANREGLRHTMQLPASWRDRLPARQLQEGSLADACELTGYVPWSFGLPGKGFEEAWSRLMEPSQFYAAYGPTTAARSHPNFMMEHSHECLWNGPSWPFATTLALMAMARVIQEYEQTYVGKEDYLELLRIYAGSHRLVMPDGRAIPWIDENLDPFTGEWIARTKLHERGDANRDRGAHYNHSAFCDLILSGLIGILPRRDDVLELHPLLPENAEWDYFGLENVAYHGREVTIFYDKHGTRYGCGPGFRVIIDGVERFRSERVQPVTILF
ncbi:hypothetical protein GZH47_13800 [Paenibacillus rhizovicinus]|uniref:Glycoside hydrolase n=1 Tax=Paenibacillus rhizovicinus TaxID=2704463 RepID=A0A6C0NZZ9_9BACL|nr:glycosyl hydrolase family 65 protein [Paenibacillus rhizovicinus]QHW31805.1 hypothetical protein GZH47_13800 [Paenibacillus rhizovicinus]